MKHRFTFSRFEIPLASKQNAEIWTVIRRSSERDRRVIAKRSDDWRVTGRTLEVKGEVIGWRSDSDQEETLKRLEGDLEV